MDETLRLPPQPVGELVWVAGGEVDECSVSLQFFGDDLDPDAITKILSIHPTKSCRKGDIFRGKVYDRIEQTGKWLYSVKRRKGISLEEQINKLFDQLPLAPEVWLELTTKFQANLFCGLWLKRWNCEFDLFPETLKKIAEKGLSIGFDVYFDPDKDEAGTQS